MIDQQEQIKQQQLRVAKRNQHARRLAEAQRKKEAARSTILKAQEKPAPKKPAPKRVKKQPKVKLPINHVPPTLDSLPEDGAGYIVAGGPSLKGFNWTALDNKFTVAVNRAYEVLPNAEIVYFTDEDYYNRHMDAMLKHSGRLIKGCTNLRLNYDPRIEKFWIKAGKGINMTPGQLVHGRNSTFAALNMLVQWGFKRVYILGADMKWGKPGDKNTSHWHDGHVRTDGEATYKNFTHSFVEAVPQLKKLEVEVINVNNDTNLKCFPIITYEDHFGKDCFI